MGTEVLKDTSYYYSRQIDSLNLLPFMTFMSSDVSSLMLFPYSLRSLTCYLYSPLVIIH